jgi:hypothetical protein
MLKTSVESTVTAAPASLAPDSTSAPDKVVLDRKGALGYAYFQSLAAQASFNCQLLGWHADGGGVDVQFQIREKLDPAAQTSDFSLEFQLRATARGLAVVDSKLLFSLESERYETLRNTAEHPRFIVLLSLPSDFDDSSDISAEELLAHRRGRWLCLSGAPQAPSTTATPVRFPSWNLLTPAALREIARRVSLGSRFFHEQ